MFISKLDVVNSCLATLGEAPLNTLEDDHAFKQAALNYLDTTNRIEQAPGWWFNQDYTQLYPDAISQYIYIPNDALSVKPIVETRPTFGQRGKRLYDPGSDSYAWGNPLWVDIIRLVTFEDLPFQAADVVQWGTVMRFQREFDGDNTRYGQLNQDYARAKLELRQEHVRNKKPNLLHNAGFQTKMIDIGPGNYNMPGIRIR